MDNLSLKHASRIGRIAASMAACDECKAQTITIRKRALWRELVATVWNGWN